MTSGGARPQEVQPPGRPTARHRPSDPRSTRCSTPCPKGRPPMLQLKVTSRIPRLLSADALQRTQTRSPRGRAESAGAAGPVQSDPPLHGRSTGAPGPGTLRSAASAIARASDRSSLLSAPTATTREVETRVRRMGDNAVTQPESTRVGRWAPADEAVSSVAARKQNQRCAIRTPTIRLSPNAQVQLRRSGPPGAAPLPLVWARQALDLMPAVPSAATLR